MAAANKRRLPLKAEVIAMSGDWPPNEINDWSCYLPEGKPPPQDQLWAYEWAKGMMETRYRVANLAPDRLAQLYRFTVAEILADWIDQI